jgi:hypothetical protein
MYACRSIRLSIAIQLNQEVAIVAGRRLHVESGETRLHIDQ